MRPNKLYNFNEKISMKSKKIKNCRFFFRPMDKNSKTTVPRIKQLQCNFISTKN